MKITEDDVTRKALFAKLLEDRFKGGYPHQHELWPCARKGAATRVLRAKGYRFGSRKAALYWQRGNSAEALIIGMTRQLERRVFTHEGVIVSPDHWTNDEVTPFREIKSTAMSSAKIWRFISDGGRVPLLDGADYPMRTYFDQCGIYAVACGANRCGLDVYFLHGDYADRRKRCPECNADLGDWCEDGLYRVCTGCGYKSFSMDLRSYTLEFTQAELAWYRREVFHRRRDGFNAATALDYPGKTPDYTPLLAAVEGTSNFFCRTCEPGRIVGCPEFRGGA